MKNHWLDWHPVTLRMKLRLEFFKDGKSKKWNDRRAWKRERMAEQYVRYLLSSKGTRDMEAMD